MGKGEKANTWSFLKGGARRREPGSHKFSTPACRQAGKIICDRRFLSNCRDGGMRSDD